MNATTFSNATTCSNSVDGDWRTNQAERPRLLIVGTFLSSAGLNRSVCEGLAQELMQRGWSVLTTSNKPSRIHRLWDMISTIWTKRNEFDVAQVDVYSGAAFRWAEASCWALRRLGKPFVLTLHGGNLPRFLDRHPRRVQSLLQSAAAVTAPSQYLLEQMLPARVDIQLLPNPLDLSVYPFRPRADPQPRLVWMRAFCNVYNPTLAPRIVAEMADEFPDLELTMVGPDKGDGSLQATIDEAERLGVRDRIEFPGGVAKAEVPNWLSKADIFLNTTNFDNTPISVMEAMACGLCTISTNVGGIPYLVQDGKNALLTPPDDAVAMASQVRRVLREPAFAESLSRAARQAMAGFDYATILPQWERLFQHVAGCPSRAMA